MVAIQHRTMKIKGQHITLPKHPVIIRYSDNGDDTLGLLFIGGVFQHYILEDEFREVKVKGETRIPAGIYPLKLRKEGGKHAAYLKRYGADFHKGMIEICEVPGFLWALYHCGNDEFDTAGCTLSGDKANNNQVEAGYIKNSRAAYERTYPKLLDYTECTENPIIEIFDMDRPNA